MFTSPIVESKTARIAMANTVYTLSIVYISHSSPFCLYSSLLVGCSTFFGIEKKANSDFRSIVLRNHVVDFLIHRVLNKNIKQIRKKLLYTISGSFITYKHKYI